MEAKNTTFRELIEGNKQFIIPVFQRDYAWEEENWRQLWDDIVRTGSVGGGGHFVGSIVHVPESTLASMTTNLVVDGQQRLTTLTVLCSALRDHIGENQVQSTRDILSAEEVNEGYLVNRLRQGNQRYKMALRRSDNETLRALIDGRSLDTLPGMRSVLISRAYAHFRHQLMASGTDIEHVCRGMMGLRLVEISLNRAIDDPQGVFESINSTGVPLSTGDLVRNHLLIGLEETEQTRLYEEYWQQVENLFRKDDGTTDNASFQRFVRDYITLKRRTAQVVRLPDIYRQFKIYAVAQRQHLSLEELLDDIRHFAGYYGAYEGSKEIQPPSLAMALRNLRSQSDTTGVLMMRLYDLYERRFLSEVDFVNGLNLVESYLVRHTVCRRQIHGYRDIFAGMAVDVSDETPAKSLFATLVRYRGANRSFPSDDAFAEALQSNEIYLLQRVKSLLDRLENDGQREPSPVNEYTVEHIMPQALTAEWQDMLGEDYQDVHAKWQHRLGNLTLTAYNASYSNRSFEEKKTRAGGFNESAVRLNRFVRGQSEWTVAQMEERGKLLAERALTIWQYPPAA